MRKLGGYMFFFGVGSIVLSFMEREFVILAWIDTWGTGVGWAIRTVLAVGGGALWFMGKPAEESKSG